MEITLACQLWAFLCLTDITKSNSSGDSKNKNLLYSSFGPKYKTKVWSGLVSGGTSLSDSQMALKFSLMWSVLFSGHWSQWIMLCPYDPIQPYSVKALSPNSHMGLELQYRIQGATVQPITSFQAQQRFTGVLFC